MDKVPKSFVIQDSFITFAALEPAKPLNNAQIGGSFFSTIILTMKTRMFGLASSKEDYIENFRRNYVECYPPAWMITEVLSFGNLNYIYSNIASNKLMKHIADYFGLKPQVFTSWLTVLANLRNMCCHHARVWNRDFMLTPAEPRKTSNVWIDTSGIDKKRIYYRLCIIRYFLSSVSPNNNFNDKLTDLLGAFPVDTLSEILGLKVEMPETALCDLQKRPVQAQFHQNREND